MKSKSVSLPYKGRRNGRSARSKSAKRPKNERGSKGNEQKPPKLFREEAVYAV